MLQGLQRTLMGALGLGTAIGATDYATRSESGSLPPTQADNPPNAPISYIPGNGMYPTPPLLWARKTQTHGEPTIANSEQNNAPTSQYIPGIGTFPKLR